MSFERKWSDEQRLAVAEAAVDYGLSYAQVARLAADGALPGRGASLDPFPMPASYIAHLGGEERRRRGQARDTARSPDQLLAETVAEAIEVARGEVLKVKRQKAPDTARMTRALRALREALALQQDIAKAQAPSGKLGPRPKDRPAADFLGSLPVPARSSG